MTLSRREFVQTGGGDGRVAGMGRPGRALRAPTGASGANFIRKASRRAIPIRTASSCGRAGRSIAGGTPATHRRGRRGRSFRRVIAQAPAPVSAAVRLDRPRAGRGSQAGAHLLVSLHRRRRQRQPRRPHAHRAAARRPAAGELRLRQLPGRQRGQAQRLSPDDLRGRARARPKTSSASCCTSATSSTRSSNIRTR